MIEVIKPVDKEKFHGPGAKDLAQRFKTEETYILLVYLKFWFGKT